MVSGNAGNYLEFTNPRVFKQPSPITKALQFARQIREQPNRCLVSPGSRHWQIFADLCEARSAAANLIPNLWFAALAIESDCEWITTDRDYQTIPSLRTRHPLR